MVWRQICYEILDGGTGWKNVVFIVYNFFEKCLNQSLAGSVSCSEPVRSPFN